MSRPVELAPNWKRGLMLANPLILASGGMTDARVGATATIPLTLRRRGGAAFPRIVELPGGILLRTGAANPGLARYVHENQRAWTNSAVPIIVSFAAQGARDWAAMAAQLDHMAGVGGVELHLNPTFDAAEAVRSVRSACELVILAKLDLDHALDQASACVDAGANALVIGRAPRGMVMQDGHPWYGRLYSPVVKVLVLRTLFDVAALGLDAPLVASGGIHTVEDVQEFLTAGACAVEIDSAAWLNPELVTQLAEWANALE